MQVRVRRSRLLPDEARGQLQRIAAALQGELALHAGHHEDERELQALGLVHGHDVDRVLVGHRFRHRGVVARFTQEVQVGHEGGHAVVLGHVAVGLHHLEEPRHVLDPRLRRGGGLAGQARQEARGLEEAVEHLARAQARHVGRRAVEVGQEPRGRLARGSPDAGQVLVPGEGAQHLEQRPVLARGVPVEPQQVRPGQLIGLGGGEVEERDRVIRMGQRAQEGHQQPDLLARIESPAAREAVRDALHVERAQEGVGVVVAAHQDRDVARAQAAGQALEDEGGHAVGFREGGVEAEVADGRARRPLRPQPLVDAGHGLEPVRVVVGDEAGRGVQDLLRRAVVVGQHHLARAGVETAEGQQVGRGRAAPAIDGLVVVAHHRDVRSVLALQKAHQLQLRVVRVLELVDQDVAVARTQAGQQRGPLPQQRQRPMDLVAKVGDPGLVQEGLIGLVEGGQLQVTRRRVH